jgi:hypothetical protein
MGLDPQDVVEVYALLDQLNRWVRESGLDPGDPTSVVRSTGESTAAIERLLERLRALGASVRWNAEARRYELDDGPARTGTEGMT